MMLERVGKNYCPEEIGQLFVSITEALTIGA
jgi:hypothetical protein